MISLTFSPAAAVALALLPGDDGMPSFVLTRRAARLVVHRGQWALPGGRLDPTAAILFQLREVAIRGDATRVAHYEQPVFAWR